MLLQTIYGPPGTGKTSTLVDIVEDQCKANRILFLSYTRSAAGEAASRLEADGVNIRTLHSLAFQILGLNRAQIVTKEKLCEFSDVCGIPMMGGDVNSDEPLEGDEYMGVYDYSRNHMIDALAAYDKLGRPGIADRFALFIVSYENWKTTYGFVDFSDMLHRVATLNDNAIPTYPVIVLDEAQDCSPAQWAMMTKITGLNSKQRVYIAGDDDQAIYEWMGADPHGMGQFSDKNKALVLVLNQSHRVPKVVHKFVHDQILSIISERHKKSFKSTAEGGTLTVYGDVSNVFEDTINFTEDTMILVRDKWRLKEAQRLLHATNTPYSIIGGASPYESRYANAIRGVLKAQAGNAPNETERDAIVNTAKSQYVHSASTRRWGEFKVLPWAQILMIPPHIIDFYQTIDLFAPRMVRLSTIHQAKGMEADTVIVDLTMPPRVEEGIYRNRDAELRVWYVALTRAKHKLLLCGGNPFL